MLTDLHGAAVAGVCWAGEQSCHERVTAESTLTALTGAACQPWWATDDTMGLWPRQP